MRICMFSIVHYYQGISGGMEIHGKLVAEGLARQGHEVVIISTQSPTGKRYCHKRGVKYYNLENTRFGSSRNNWKIASGDTFITLNENRAFDVILSQSFAAGGVLAQAKQSKIPIITMLQGAIGTDIKKAFNHLYKLGKTPVATAKSLLSLPYNYFFYQYPVLKASCCVVTPNNELINELGTWYGNDIKRKAVPIYNGVNTERFAPSGGSRNEIRKKYKIGENYQLMGHISNDKHG